MAWYYNNIRIFVASLDESATQIIARLQPLSATTVLQVFGDEAPVYKVDGYIVGSDIKDSLLDLLNDGTAYTLSGVDFTKDLYLSKLGFKRSKYPFQTIDTNRECTEPVFEFSMELMK